jgi:hypothetical protein
MERKPQTYANHVKFDVVFHFILLPVALILLIGSLVGLFRHPGISAVHHLLLVVVFVLVLGRIRAFPLGVQDRVIRLEEKLRMMTVLKEPLRSRIGELQDTQIVALRFAPDEELPGLVQRAIDEKLSRSDIKKAIKNWRPDYGRI